MDKILLIFFLIVTYDSLGKRGQAIYCLIFPIAYGFWLDFQTNVENIEVCVFSCFAVFLIGIYKASICLK